MSETAVAEPVAKPAPQFDASADKAARDAAVKQADTFFRENIKDAPKGSPSDLFKKMAEKLNQDTTQFQEKVDEEKQVKREAEENRAEPEVKASSVDDEKKPGYIKSLKQTNEQLAKEAAELKQKVAEYDKAKQEIEELRSKIDDS